MLDHHLPLGAHLGRVPLVESQMRWIALLVLATSSAPLSHGAAQEPGQRIRLRTGSAPSAWVVGTLVFLDGDSLRIRVAGETAPVVVARPAVQRLEVAKGLKRATFEGGSIGFGLGVIAGAVVASTGAASRSCGGAFVDLCAIDTEAHVVEGGLIGGAIGGVVGAGLGYLVRTERWEPLPSARARVTLARRGAGLAVSLAF